MVESQSTSVVAAQAILAGASSPDGTDIAALEKKLAREGARELAHRLRARRLELDVTRAYDILSGAGSEPPLMLKLAKRLASDKRFGLARRILKAARQELKRSDFPSIFVEIFQKSALYTYKDPDLPLDWRLDRALELLQEVEDLASTQSSESLGLAGAIHKRKWEVDSGRHHLDRALSYYLRGYAQGAPEAARGNVLQYLRDHPTVRLRADDDRGYNGINAAFILDLLARQEEEEAARAGLVPEAALKRRDGARLIREEIIRSVPPLLQQSGNDWLAEEWWFYATIGEAYFGLGEHAASNYDEAVEWLVTKPEAARQSTTVGAALEVPEWEYESTARQLARLALLQGKPGMSEAEFEASDAGRALARFLRSDHQAVRSAFRGKFGLALSGGGFRASLFHIGVLASLAELGVLRHVEVLSCVSGGSIIGAHYYLELQRLLQNKRDDDIRREDYVEIVARIEQQFLEGVQRNIRTRVLAEWTTNLRMIFKAGYSRTLRVGELYERELFSRVPDDRYQGPRWVPDWIAKRLGWKRERWLDDLYVHPMSAQGVPDDDFVPRNHNWRRANKVPVLILNSTALNTGHCWQFTASFMGEPPTPINAEIDANDRLRRMYHEHAPKAHRKVRLGHAVAASSCVPGLFEPLILDGLYPDRSVRLVDGGVCDNQGVASLLEQDSTVLLVSDASGQMESQRAPSSGVVGVPLRTNGILQARVREAQYSDVASRRRSSLLRALMFVHLKRDLPAEQVAWQDCPSYLKESDFVPKRGLVHDATSYNVAVMMQRKLAAIRTDLDSFNDAEAFALMTSGYLMTTTQFVGKDRVVEGFAPPLASVPWRFLSVASALKPPAASPNADAERRTLAKLLDAGAGIAFKVWKLSPVLIALKWILAIVALAGALWFVYAYRDAAVLPQRIAALTFKDVGLAVLTIGLVALVSFIVNRILGDRSGKRMMRLIQWRDTVRYVLTGIGMSTVGFLLARLHLHVFDKVYLRRGRVATK